MKFSVSEFMETLQALALDLWQWAEINVLDLSVLAQLVGVALLFLGSRFAAARIRPLLQGHPTWYGWVQRGIQIILPLILPLIWWLLLLLVTGVVEAAGAPSALLSITLTLVGVWILIRLVTAPLRNRSLSATITVVAWTLAALSIVGWLPGLTAALDARAITIGEGRLTLLALFTGALSLVVLVWLSILVSNVIEQQLQRAHAMDASARVLLGKLARVALVALAIIVGLTSAGLDLTVFAVLGGAIGLGLGFGLQKVVSNLFSGMILLLDRSIKPGDVIEVQGTYGWINRLAARYTSVITRDGTEFLIPNEDMVTQVVLNWSHSHRLVRRKLTVGISYNSDVSRARELMVEAAKNVERVLANPLPQCQLLDFGDSAIILELRYWIEDPQNGVSNVASDVRLQIWDLFRDNGIEFPYPQQDVHIVSAPGLPGLQGSGD